MGPVAALAAKVESFVREVVAPYETDPRCGGAHGPTNELVEELREKARVDDGVSFNLFDVRYPLREGLSVAIIVPTKNHAKLLRDCIESIWATVTEVPYEIVVVDHESDDPETIEYLASIPSSVRILPYKGPFNFSAINNWAVKQARRSSSR